jgi:hypothetical protein
MLFLTQSALSKTNVSSISVWDVFVSGLEACVLIFIFTPQARPALTYFGEI